MDEQLSENDEFKDKKEVENSFQNRGDVKSNVDKVSKPNDDNSYSDIVSGPRDFSQLFAPQRSPTSITEVQTSINESSSGVVSTCNQTNLEKPSDHLESSDIKKETCVLKENVPKDNPKQIQDDDKANNSKPDNGEFENKAVAEDNVNKTETGECTSNKQPEIQSNKNKQASQKPNKNKMDDRKKESQGTSSSLSKEGNSNSKICLKFHIIISYEDLRKNGAISLAFLHSFKNFLSGNGVMTFRRFPKSLADGIQILQYDVDIPKDRLVGNTISYSYKMSKGDDSCKFQVNFDWLRKFQELNEWNIYDVCLPSNPQKGIMNSIKSFFVGSHDGNSVVVLDWYYELFPKVLDDNIGSGKDFVVEFMSVFISAKKTLKLLKIEESNLSQIAIASLKELKSKNSNEDLSKAACVLFILMECKFWDDEIASCLCSWLSIRSDGNKKCFSYDHFCKVFPNDLWKRRISDALLEFLKKIVIWRFVDPNWILTLPLLHFLEKTSKPFQELEIKSVHENKEWWGISNIKDLVDICKNSMSDNMPLDLYLVTVTPMFEVDHLLPRSLLAIMSLRHIPRLIGSQMFPLDACLANIIYFVNYYKNYYTRPEELIMNCLIGINELMNKLKKSGCNRENKLDNYLHYILKLTFQLLECIMDSFYNGEIKLQSISIMTSAICMALNIIEKLDDKDKDHAKGSIHEYFDKTIFIQKHFRFRDPLPFRASLLVCSGLSEFLLESSSMWNDWEQCIKGYFVHEFEKMQLQDKCERFSEIMKSTHYAVIKDWTSESMLKEVENWLKRSSGELQIVLKHDNDHTFRDIFDKIVKEIWPVEPADDLSILSFTMNNPIFQKLPTLYNVNNLGEESVIKLTRALSLLENVECSLLSGELKIKLVRVLLNDQKKFLKTVESVSGVKGDWKERENQIKKSLQEYEYCIEAYEKRCNQIRVLLDFCGKYEMDELQILKNEVAKEINDLCLSDIRGASTSLKIMGIDRTSLDMLMFLECYQESMILNDLWKRHSRKLFLNPKATLSDMVDSVYMPCREDFKIIAKSLNDGTMLMSEVEDRFLRFDDYDLRRELKFFCNDKFYHEICGKIGNYKKLRTCKRGAEVMLEFKEKFELTGSFEDIEQIADIAKRGSLKLCDITDEFVKECRVLQDFSAIKRRCLEVFIEGKEFVEWLRETLSGSREIKVLVELALSSAEGQGDMEMEKVSCFHAAATAYSSLIYDLKQDMDFREFLALCEPVWAIANVNAKIAENFRDAARELKWLNGIKESHGAVEVNALQSAALINSKGIFTVGNFANNASQLTLEDVVQMKLYLKKGEKDAMEEVSESLDSEKWKIYSLKQLCDLQSKLMLVAGKAHEGRKDIEGFNRTLHGILRLAGIYVELVDRGCCMFISWKVTFFCNPTKSMYARIDFTSDDKTSEYIFGKSSQVDSMKIHERIENMCEVLDKCLEEWNNYIQNKRIEKHFMNFYTTKQLVVLQREIATAFNNKDDDSNLGIELFMLLSLICSSCTKNELLSAATSALQQFSKSNDNESQDVAEISDDDKDSMNDFVSAMVEAGFSLSLAEAAERNVISGDVQEGIIWCMENEGNIEQEETEQTHVQKENLQSGKINFHEFLQEETKNLSKKSTSEKIEKKFMDIWRIFLDQIDIGYIDHISLEQLSLVLENLGKENQTSFQRILPFPMKDGKPNLVLCNQSEIWITVLSVYANSSDLALPSVDEVLVCNQNTSAEEIEIMCLRARKDKSGKLYCLVHAELLDYRVAVSAERFINLIGDGTKFVIVCASNTHSHIADAFDQHKVKYLPHDMQEIKTYVQQNLTQRDSEYSFIDPEDCSVRLIKSNQAGTGKTLRIKRAVDKISEKKGENPSFLTLPLQNKEVNVNEVVKSLRRFAVDGKEASARVVHFDISTEVVEGVDCFLFNLLILGSLSDEDGYVWKKLNDDVYFIESYPHKTKGSKDNKESNAYLHKIFSLLPSFNCWSPNDSLIIMKSEIANKFVLDQKVDEKEFRSESFQRVCSYLESEFKQPNQAGPIGSIELLIKFCGVENPSWAELKHFIDFFNTQLLAYEKSIFCQTFMAADLPGFRKFVIDFMLLMSQDFSTRSLKISEESPDVISDFTENMDESLLLGGYEMKRTWETSSHPYLFFNDDGHSFTFIGFVVDRATGNIINPENRKVLLRSAVSQQLFDALHRNNVNLQEDFDRLDRVAKLRKMATIMGLDVHDPDESYELTADNVKKMMAIYMRFRCGIPVVIMGETGCGKTCLIKYLCNFMKPPFSDMKNMFLMKIHGGTTIQNIVDKIRKVIKIAKENSDQLPGIKTVLFFDEANTTSAIGLIKEAMCDQTIAGESFDGTDLKLVAACNPYRKHSDELINKLEKAGLGYHVSASKTTDRLGTIPMRQLVYRVRSLPPSMFPLVWDFGFLDEDAEKLYIRQMVQRCIEKGLNIAPSNTLVSNITKILVASQSFMRRQNDESSFVSLRDVERCLRVMAWFYTHDNIFAKMDQILLERKKKKCWIEEDEDSEEDADNDDISNMDDLTRSLILALGVCYHACLSKREEYRTFISPHFRSICALPRGPDTILEEISTCQDVFLNEVVLDKNIARNQALKENLFVMVICIELRIPLFLIGKPGSSKSLAKTVLADAMQGNQSKSKLFQSFKSAHMISYQCSPLSTPEGITGMFRQCAKLQESKDLDKFVSIVVLDEVGLAEDSEKMPLKALHPLLEDGCEDEDESLPHKKVAFIGISNWSLDPAKMNRGIFVQRSPPDEEELYLSACGICSSDPITTKHCEKLFKPLAKGYLKLCETALEIREFFGLRDFYSLIKMISSMSKSIRRTPSWHELQKPILRNFSGLENIDVIGMFKDFIKEVIDTKEDATADRSLVASSLIRESLNEIDLDSESRYLLILMDNYSSFNLLQHDLLEMNEANLIFGSNFPKDLEYTQICRNINRIKIYMETGKTVVLLNLENLYESLYDALNQYYVMFNGERFVDLGLGTQRVKCKVHKSFRLIVVADKEVVYKRFPIPLINRLEKHCLAVESLLTLEQMDISRELRQWADQFIRATDQTRSKNKLTLADVFIGFHTNALASLVLQAFSKLGKKYGNSNMEEILEHCQDLLLQCAVPEALHRTSEIDGRNIYETYFEKQHHKAIMEFLQSYVIESSENIFAQITTHSRLLLKTEVNEMTRQFGLPPQSIEMLSLQAFATEQQFSGELKSFFESEIQSVLIIQCDSGDQNGDLIACTRFIIGNEYSNWEGANDERVLNKHILLIIQLPKVMGGCFVGFQGGKWLSYHIDNLQPDPDFMSLLPQMKDKSVSSLLNSETLDQLEDEGNLKQQSESTNKIIESCIHSAAALLRGPVGNLRSRKTARLDPLVRNLRKNYDNDKMLVDILRERVSQLLYEREANVTIAPECWLTREATTLDAVCSAGSFDKSVIQCLESKVTPILAYIIAYIDSYCNLDLLDSSEEFIVNLWFEMFKNTSITSMKYSDIQTISQSMAFQFEVKTFTQDNSLMKCQLPFSWIIKEYLDKLISQHQAHNERMKDIEFDVEDFFSSSEVGRLLERFSLDDDSRQKIFEMYLFDYIKMSYRPSSSQVDKELEMVANDLRSIVLKPTMTFEDFQDGDIWTLSKVHYTYKEQLLKYKLFAEFVRYCPECIDDLYAAKVNNMSLLQLCLMYVLENLAYNNKVKSVKSWADKVKSLTYVVNQLFHHAQLENLDGLMCVWNRICALKLFIEHNSSNELVDDIIYNRLWAYLGERFNLKSLKCFENVEKFLKSCDDKGLEKCFGKILPSKCCMCKGGNGIISLICEHKYCQECFDEVLAVHNKRCFSCAGIAQEQGDCSIAKEDVEKYVAFKRRLNSFFMAIVSKMCFDGSHPPDDEIIKKLLERVVFKSETDNQLRTRNLLVGRNDPNPVIRSFLLQLLLKHQMDSVESYLTKFLNDAQNILQNDMNQILELYILCLNCFEDHYQNLGATSANLTDRLELVKRLWKDNKLIDLCRVSSRNYGLDVTTLKKMSLLRYGLKELADGLYGHYLMNNLDECGYCATRSLGDLATTIFITNDQARLYLMKEITHKFGFKVLLQFAEKPQCKWFLTPHHLKDDKSKEEESTLDHFLLCGGDYKNTRDALFQAMLQKNPSLLDDVKLMDYNLTLAMFRHLHQSTAEADVLMWDEYFSANKNLTGKDLILLLMKHKLKMVAFKPRTRPMDNDLLDLIFHFMVATKFMHSKNIIIELLCIPINTPGSVKDSYLPTMPEDNTFEALQLINQKELAVFYRCPNGHPYSIGDCGQPGFFGRCSGCGQVIGGQNHVLAAGNTNANALADSTSPGHVLGRPISTNNPSGERLMTPIEVSITRLLLHVSLYVGSFDFDFSRDAIKPQLNADEVHEYFLVHMEHDLNMVQRSSGQNRDNAFILLHKIINDIHNKRNVPNLQLSLISKAERMRWEEEFVKEYIRPHLENVNELIENGRKLMLEDDGIVLSPLMKKIYEVDQDNDIPGSLENLHECQLLWKFRVRISREQLLVNLQNSSKIKEGNKEEVKKQYSLLQYFLENINILQEIRHLPAIMDLHKKLVESLSRRISNDEAKTCTVSEFLKQQEDMTRRSFELLFEEFCATWNTLRSNFCKFAFLRMTVPEMYLKEYLNLDSKIGFFLPTVQGLGICSVGLVHYLIDQQNKLLDVYETVTKQRILKKVSLDECISIHLLMLEPEKELHTLILANCNYSLEVGRTTKLEYDYANLEMQVVDHFVFDKPRIEPGMKVMNFKEEFNVSRVFAELEYKIPQETKLPEPLENDFKILSDVSTVLLCLTSVLEFIVSVEREPNKNIVDFMINTLKMKNMFEDYPSMTSLQFKHAKQAWLTLSFIQAKLQVKNGRLPFSNVDDKYKEVMSKDVHQRLTNCFQSINVDSLSLILFECILLNVTSGMDEDYDNSKQGLGDILLAYISTKNLDERFNAFLENGSFPKEILACHCFDVWLSMVDPEKRKLLNLS